MFFPVVLAQIEAEKTVAQKGFLALLMDSDPLIWLVLIILAFFSVMSWAIIFMKLGQLKRARNLSTKFWQEFVRARSLNEVIETKSVKSGPLFEIFNTAIETVARLKKGARNAKDALESKLAQVREEETYKLEQYISFLATTASTTPYIGLFGTVWGILTAFWAIGKSGASNLATVGPFISEALITTAVGLAAAIPAVIAYNYFVGRIRVVTKMMDLFIDDLMVKIEEE